MSLLMQLHEHSCGPGNGNTTSKIKKKSFWFFVKVVVGELGKDRGLGIFT